MKLKYFQASLVAFCFIIASVFILEVEFMSNQARELSVGDVSRKDLVAPTSVTYESTIATKAAQDRAERAVSDFYRRPDPNVARHQRNTAKHVLTFVDAVRADRYASDDQKVAWLQQLEPTQISKTNAEAILKLDDNLWLDAKREIISLLDEAMSTDIRASQLVNVRLRLPVMVSTDVSDAESLVVIALVEDLIQPNTFVDEERTQEAKQKARESVETVFRTFEQNEIVVRAGEIISVETIEALQILGMRGPDTPVQEILATFIWMIILTNLLGYYIYQYHPHVLEDKHRLFLLVGTLLLFVLAIRIMVPNLTYALPIAAFTIIIAALLEPRLAIVSTLMLAFVLVYMAGDSLELLAYAILPSIVVSLTIGNRLQLHNLLWAGVQATLSNVAIILVFYFLDSRGDTMALTTKMGQALLSGGLAVGLAPIALFIIGKITGITTYIQLLELSRPTHPLLAELLRRAPGSYHHSLLVSNLAEQAAERIGADAFLCRIGAYYHDVGKMLRPYFFTENTIPETTSLHNGLNPETSAQIIISHVTEGLELAKKYHLPPVIRSFIAEHHGTEVVNYFYHQAKESAKAENIAVDKSRFTYPGPRPQSRESAIMMLADASEATVRSVQPQTLEEIDQIVRRTITQRMGSGQFDDCGLTMGDLEQIRIAFNEVLKGVSHPRVKYPDQLNEEAKLKTGPLPLLPLAVQSATSLTGGKPTDKIGRFKFPIPRD